MSLFRTGAAAAMVCGTLLITACQDPSYDAVSMADQIANNTEDSGHWTVLSRQLSKDGTLTLRVRAENENKVERIAEKALATQKNLGAKNVRIEVIGPSDPDGAAPRAQESLLP